MDLSRKLNKQDAYVMSHKKKGMSYTEIIDDILDYEGTDESIKH